MTSTSDRSQPTRLTPTDQLGTRVTSDGLTQTQAIAPAVLPVIPDVEIGEIIGRGGMGVVYKGRQSYIDRPVAVKLLLVDKTDGDEFVKRFQREAKILAGLAHPHIVSCYQAGLTPIGDPYLVMEYIDGPNLREWLNSHGPLNEPQTISIIRDLAQALEHAYSRSIIHRDVKPENILLQKRASPAADDTFPYTVKLVDLGLARPARLNGESSLTKQGMVMGTPATMAPEQFENPDSVDFKADMYGLGCVLYHALTGHPAFPSPTLAQLITAKISGVIPDPSREVKGLSRPALDLGRALLAHDKDQRPASYAHVITCCTELLNPPAPTRRTLPSLIPTVMGVVIVATTLTILGVMYAHGGSIKAYSPPRAVPAPSSGASSSVPSEVAAQDTPGASAKPLSFGPDLPLTTIGNWLKIGNAQWDRSETVNNAISGMAGEINHLLRPGLWQTAGILTLANAAEQKTDSMSLGVVCANGVRYAVTIKNLSVANLIEIEKIDSDGTHQVLYTDSRNPKSVHVSIRHDSKRFLEIETDDIPMKQAIGLPRGELPFTALFLSVTNSSLSQHGPAEVRNLTVSYPKP